MDRRIRLADSLDASPIVDLVQSAYRGETSRTGWTTEAHLLEGQRTDLRAVTEVIDAPDSVVLVVSDGGSPLACCHLEKRGDRAYFGMFAVAPDAQNTGIGRALLTGAEEFAVTVWGSTHLEMTVIRQRTDLIAYYVRRGYTDTAIRSPFPYGDERFGVPLRDDLEFTLLEKRLTPPV